MKVRHRSNYIIAVKISTRLVVEPISEVKEEIKNYFAVRFQRSTSPRPYLQNIPFRRLSNQDCRSLEEAFFAEEIKEAVFVGDRDKSLGPDGFNLDFMKKCWNIVCGEVVSFIQ